MAALNSVRPVTPTNKAWANALEAAKAVAPIIPKISKDGKRYADIALYLYRRTPSIIKTYKGTALVARTEWDEHIIRFPHWFPEALIRESLDNNDLWSLWVQGNQWVSETIGAIGPAAAGGAWSSWWETADVCDWP